MTQPDPASRACERKIKYPGLKAANRALRVLRKKTPDGGALYTYKCPICRQYHIGNDRGNAYWPLDH